MGKGGAEGERREERGVQRVRGGRRGGGEEMEERKNKRGGKEERGKRKKTTFQPSCNGDEGAPYFPHHSNNPLFRSATQQKTHNHDKYLSQT